MLLGAAVVMVKVTCPAAVVDDGAVQVPAVGAPLHENVIVPPAKPLASCTFTVALTVPPAVTGRVATRGLRVKSGDVVVAEDHAIARLLASTEPRPVTRL